MTPSSAYLSAYNALCAGGWAAVLLLSLRHLADGGSLSSVCSDPFLVTVLVCVQSAAIMEVLHAVSGLVRSPAVVTAMQVGSRLAAIFALTGGGKDTLERFGAGLMVISWSLVEVPRYLFYLAAILSGDATKGTPYPLFWLRYSLFAVLYPSGITGEVLTFLAASKSDTFLTFLGESETCRAFMYYFIMSIPVIYAPGSPFMIMNMAGNRKSAFRKRFARPPPPPRGLVFPVTGTKNGKPERSTTVANRDTIVAAVAAVNPHRAEKARNEKNWRFKYMRHYVTLVEEQCKSREAALAVAEAGLQHLYEKFEFVHEDGTSSSFGEAMARTNSKKFHTGTIQGTGPANTNKFLEIPYHGKMLSGQPLKDQVQKWVDYGTIEPDCGAAICKVVDNPTWMDLSDKHFVLLGAGSAMGPFRVLMALGANVVAVDLDRPNIWKGLIDVARNSSGSITFPLSTPQSDCADDTQLYAAAGCNLFTHTPLIKDWLLDLHPGKHFVVGSYAYLDGALHVQVSLAMDSICKALTERRPHTSLVYLCTPTDCHLVPAAACAAAQADYETPPTPAKQLLFATAQLLSGGKYLQKNARPPIRADDGTSLYLVNGLSVQQGPNYALAKRLQHWRAIVARERKSCTVSSNVAPATATASVVRARMFAWAYEGMPSFRPYEIAEPDTSKAAMLALLLFDLRDGSSAASPGTELSNPNQLMMHGSFNGGSWRCAYTVDSIGEMCVLLHFSQVGGPYLVGAAAVGVGVVLNYLGYFSS